MQCTCMLITIFIKIYILAFDEIKLLSRLIVKKFKIYELKKRHLLIVFEFKIKRYGTQMRYSIDKNLQEKLSKIFE